MKKQELMNILNDKDKKTINILFNTNTKEGKFLLGIIFASNNDIQIDINNVSKDSLLYDMLNTWNNNNNNNNKHYIDNNVESDYYLENNNNYSYNECIDKLNNITNAKSIMIDYHQVDNDLFFELGMIYYIVYNNRKKLYVINYDDHNDDLKNKIINNMLSFYNRNKKRTMSKKI